MTYGKVLQVCPRRVPLRGRHRVFRNMPTKSTIFFRFWDTDVEMFRDVEVCPLSEYRNLPFKPLTLLGMYETKYKRIYLDDMRDVKTFFHEASHHIVTQHMPQLYKTHRGRAVEEVVADIAAAVATKRVPVPRGVGWQLIEMGLHLKPCRRLHYDEDGDPYLPNRCILVALKARPRLIHLFS
jgi:hypothetical protein